MSDIVFTIALGRVADYCQRVVSSAPVATAALVCVPLETSGLQADPILRQHDSLGSILGASNRESLAGRKVVDAAADITGWDAPIDAENKLICRVKDQVWLAVPGTVAEVSAFLWCYAPNPADSNLNTFIPLTKQGRVWRPDGSSFTLSGPNGFYQATAL